MADLTLSAAQVAGALDVSERSVWRWLEALPRPPRAGLGRGHHSTYRFTLAQLIPALRARRKQGLSTDEAQALVAAGCVSNPAAIGDANLRVGDPAQLLAVLRPDEAERARQIITAARRGLTLATWMRPAPELEAVTWRVVLHPAALLAIFGDPQHLPAAEHWPAFIHCFALANSAPAHFTAPQESINE